MKKFILGILFMILFHSQIAAQIKTWDIVTKSGHPYADIVLDRVENDSLFVKAYGEVLAVSVDSIKYIKREKKSLAGFGIIFGAVAGALIGNTVAKNSADNKGLFGGEADLFAIEEGTTVGMILGGILGLAIGEGLSRDEYYNFEKREIDEKNALLIKLINGE